MECGVAGVPEGARGNPALLTTDYTDPFTDGIDEEEFLGVPEFLDRDHALFDFSLGQQMISEDAGQQSAFDRRCEEFAVNRYHDICDGRFRNLTPFIPKDNVITTASPRGLVK